MWCGRYVDDYIYRWPCIVEDDPDFDSYFYLEKKNGQVMVSI